ncbi:MAG: SMC-Scp complex subunit ScpB [Chloroflexi bacterium]|nr:SMC-Scp complex subunit ScpB [Chloroflexota bacterium]
MDNRELVRILESLLFVADGPVALEQLARILDVDRERVEAAISQWQVDRAGSGLIIQRKGNEVQMVTAPEMAPYVERFLGIQLSGRLSPAALETLGIVAYRQPVTRAQVEAIRGVNSEGVLGTLVARGLVCEVGRLEAAGRPILYGTTFEFLRYFGLRDLTQLPPLPD